MARQFTLRSDDPNGGSGDGAPAPPAPPDSDDALAILGGLNEAQREAAATVDGPVMIVAGPGSGKTRTLTHRIGYLMASGRARPWEVLALTFTNKAAREMRERATKLVGPEVAKGLWMGTFHSIFARILRAEAEHIGFPKAFSIYDPDDVERVLKQLMSRYGVDPKQFKPRAVKFRISGAKNQLVSPQEYSRLASDHFEEMVAKLYGPYQDALRAAGAMDFDDLLVRPIELFQNHPEVLQKYQRRWKYVHIDEYQDTNRAQYLLAKLLAASHKNICVVGDDAQSIYAFRGADIQNILSFQSDYPEAKTVRLEQNYRSTGTILKLADAIIKNNTGQLEKNLWTDNRDGEPVRLMECISEKDEAQKIERTMRDLAARAGYSWREFAVLYRTNAQSRSIEEGLRRGGIPYRLVGGVSFYQRREIKDALAYLRLATNPNDEASLRRVINTPARGIGAKTIQQLNQFAINEGLSLWQAAERVQEVGLSSRAKSAVEKFAFTIAHHASKSETASADEIAQSLIDQSGLMASYREEKTVESLARSENVIELINAVKEYTEAGVEGEEPRTLARFLQEVALVTDLDDVRDDDNRVTLMTLHASKGLEFKVVFVTGLEEGLFPLAMAAQDAKELEEERRLFYVGVTRAEELLYLSYARSRYRYGEQQSGIRSRFLDEVDVDGVIMTETGRSFRGKKDRFQLDAGPKADPYSYRRNLRTEQQQARGTYAGTDEEREAAAEESGRRVVYDEGEGELVPGVEVEHGTFGRGKVIAIEGRGDRATATVFFRGVGQKKLKLKYARLQVVG